MGRMKTTAALGATRRLTEAVRIALHHCTVLGAALPLVDKRLLRRQDFVRTMTGSGAGDKGSSKPEGKPWSPHASKSVVPKRSPYSARQQPQTLAMTIRQNEGAPAERTPPLPSAADRTAADAASEKLGAQVSTIEAASIQAEDASRLASATPAGAPARQKGGQRQQPRKPAGREPKCPLATLVRTEAEAQRVVEYLSQKKFEKNIFAVDTETEGVDPTEQSPVGNGKVVCFSVYCGPAVDFSAFAETLNLSDVAARFDLHATTSADSAKAPTNKTDAQADEAHEADEEHAAAEAKIKVSPPELKDRLQEHGLEEGALSTAGLRVAELKEKLKEKGLSIAGLKADLVERLNAAIESRRGGADSRNGRHAAALGNLSDPPSSAHSAAAPTAPAATAATAAAMRADAVNIAASPHLPDARSTDVAAVAAVAGAAPDEAADCKENAAPATAATALSVARRADAGPAALAARSTRLWVDTAGGEGEAVMLVFKPWLENAKFKKVFHNWSFDSHVFANHGVSVKGFAGDTMHMARLFDSSRSLLSGGGYKLSALCQDFLGWGKTDMKVVFGVARLKKDGTPGKVKTLPSSLELQTETDTNGFRTWVHYSTFDSVCTYYLYYMLRKELELTDWSPDDVMSHMSLPSTPFAPGARGPTDPSARPTDPSAKLAAGARGRSPKARNLWHFYEKCWRPFGEILTHIERNGVFVDSSYLLQQAEIAERDKEKKQQVFRHWAAQVCPDGHYLNARSVTQKRHLLFSSVTVEVTIDMANPLKHKGMKRSFKAGDVLELAYADAHLLLASKAARLVDMPPEADPLMKTFTVDNTEGLLEAGRTKPKATREISIRGLCLKPVLYTATGAPSTSGAVLAHLAGRPFEDPPKYGSAFEDLQARNGPEFARESCEALAALVEAEQIDKLLSTFLRTLPKMADEKSRIHTALNLNTETGRLSSMRPNLQNQPALEKDVYKVRRAFGAQQGNKLIVVDYGQLELRIMAHMTRCKSMISAFELGGDFHSRTAIDMYPHVKEAVDRQEVLLEWDKSNGKAPAPMLKDQFASERRKAKTLNFSIAYGKTKMGLAADWKVTVKEAGETIGKWYDARKEVRDWQDAVKKKAWKLGYTETLLGRRRKLPDIHSGDVVARGHAERAAINTPIQGGAADVVTMAMINIFNNQELRKIGWKMVLQVHDEIILEGPEKDAAVAYKIVQECMEKPFAPRKLLVALPVDGAIVNNWYEAK